MEKEEKSCEKKRRQIQESVKKQLVSPEIDAIPPKNPKDDGNKNDAKKKE